MQKGTLINTKEQEVTSFWLYGDEKEAKGPPSRNGNVDLYDFDLSDGENEENECCRSLLDTSEIIRDYKKLLYDKLSFVKLNDISIPPISNNIPHILNLKQEFTFPQSNFTDQRDNFTQTVKPTENRIKTPYPYAALRDLIEDQTLLRPQSFPMDTPSNHSMKYTRHNNMRNKIPNEHIGDGINNNLRQIKCNLYEVSKMDTNVEDLEVVNALPCQNPVQCVIVKPKNQSTPKFKCKKANQRPSTKQMRKKEMSRDDEDKSSAISVAKNNLPSKKSSSNSSKESKTDVASSDSTNICNVGGSCYVKLCAIVEHLQDFEWEVCIDGLRSFLQIAGNINWDSELGARFIPIISRKLIDFFKSPRSNLCRTACQVAGEFFLLAKSTKRPEFDEMVDLLLCKTADPNKFIQKDANTALDKMALCISVHHSVRAVCAKGSSHKNPIVRSTTARVLAEICKKAGNEQIIGSDGNPRTRKRVMSNLAIFLLDKNMETRRNGEQLCRLLRSHKFFMEYFFKDIENNLKVPLRKILNQLR